MESLAAFLYHLDPIDTADLVDLEDAFNAKSYEEGETYGFRSIFNDGSRLYATLVRRTATMVPRFDLETLSLVDEEIFVYSEIDFSVDAVHGLLEVFGPMRNAPKVSAALRPELDPEARLSRVHLVPSEVLGRLKDGGLKCAVQRLTVSQFRHAEGVVGRFDAMSVTEAFVERVVGQYDEEIGRLRMDVTLPDGRVVVLSISMSGQLRIIGLEQDVEPAYSEIKAALFGQA